MSLDNLTSSYLPKISGMWSLAAFVVASLLAFLNKRKSHPSSVIWLVVVGILVLGLTPIVGTFIVQNQQEIGKSEALYRVRVTVVDPQHVPVEDAKLWSSFGGEPKRVSGGWEFDIPRISKPTTGVLIIYADKPSVFLKGEVSVPLATDYNPGATITLRRDDSAKVRGIVADDAGHSLANVFVCVVGYNSEGIKTKDDGGFVLAAHAADNQQVELHAQKIGYKSVDQWHPAGDEAAYLTLRRR